MRIMKCDIYSQTYCKYMIETTFQNLKKRDEKITLANLDYNETYQTNQLIELKI